MEFALFLYQRIQTRGSSGLQHDLWRVPPNLYVNRLRRDVDTDRCAEAKLDINRLLGGWVETSRDGEWHRHLDLEGKPAPQRLAFSRLRRCFVAVFDLNRGLPPATKFIFESLKLDRRP